jgi:hypothetical protein
MWGRRSWLHQKNGSIAKRARGPQRAAVLKKDRDRRNDISFFWRVNRNGDVSKRALS